MHDQLKKIHDHVFVRECTRRLCNYLAFVVLGILLFAACERVFQLSEFGIISHGVVLAVFILMNVFVFKSYILDSMREFSRTERLAACIDRTHPQFNDLVTTVVTFMGQRNDSSSHRSSQLIQSVIDSAEPRFSEVNVNRIVPAGKVLMSILMSATVLTLGAMSLSQDSEMQTAALRSLFPLHIQQAKRAPTLQLTHINSRPIEKGVIYFEGAEILRLGITNRAGALPPDLWLEIEDDPDQKILVLSNPAANLEENSGDYEITEFIQSGEIRLRAASRKAISDWYVIRRRSTLDFEWYRWRVIPPEYTNRAETSMLQGVDPDEVLVGSRFVFEGKLDGDPTEIVITYGDKRVFQQGRGSGSDLIRCEFETRADQQPVVKVYASDQETESSQVVRTFSWKPVEDRVPAVHLRSSLVSKTVAENGTIELWANVSDDYGLQSVEVEYMEGSGKQKSVLLKSEHFNQKQYVETYSDSIIVDLNKVQVRSGDELSFKLMGRDYSTMNPVSLTEITYQIVSRQQKLDELEKSLRQVIQILEQETRLHRKLTRDVENVIQSTDNSRSMAKRKDSVVRQAYSWQTKLDRLLFEDDDGIQFLLTQINNGYSRNRLEGVPRAVAVEKSVNLLNSIRLKREAVVSVDRLTLHSLDAMLKLRGTELRLILSPLVQIDQHDNLLRELREILEDQQQISATIQQFQAAEGDGQSVHYNIQPTEIAAIQNVHQQLGLRTRLLITRQPHDELFGLLDKVDMTALNYEIADVIRLIDQLGQHIQLSRWKTASVTVEAAIQKTQSILTTLGDREVEIRDAQENHLVPAELLTQQKEITKWMSKFLEVAEDSRFERQYLLQIREYKQKETMVRNQFEQRVARRREATQSHIKNELVTRLEKTTSQLFDQVIHVFEEKTLTNQTLNQALDIEKNLITWAEIMKAEERSGQSSRTGDGQDIRSQVNSKDENSAPDKMNSDSTTGVSNPDQFSTWGSTNRNQQLPISSVERVDKTFWGRLPDDKRAVMRSTYPVEFLPHYSDSIQRYFQSLSQRQRMLQKVN